MDTKKFCLYSEDEIKALLKERMNEHRYTHSVNVARRAEFLAKRNGADLEKAYFAGLVHDICKGIPKEEQLVIIKSSETKISKSTEEAPNLWHSLAGAIWLEHEFGVTDSDVLNAVKYHTTGRAGMSILEKVIYMADLTSDERSYPDAEYTRKLTDKSLDMGIAYGVRWICNDLLSRGQNPGEDSLALLKEYKNVVIE